MAAMRTSQLLLATLREAPADAEIVSHQLMLRAGMARRTAAGIYNWLPLGLRAMRKVETVIRQEMDASGAQEVLLSAVQPAELWQESGRWEEYGPELLRLRDRHGRDFCIGPTHEEVITDIIRRDIRSYKQLPANFYQIQTKFRDEIRPRFGVMRSREFVMKDGYSFHLSHDSLAQTYQRMHDAYCRIFERLGLKFRAVQADSGNIGGKVSHEFHVLADSGEDRIAYSEASEFAMNVELLRGEDGREAAAGDPAPDGSGPLKIARGIEVGHIFQLGTKYSEAMKASCLDENGAATPLFMGCYGIGVSRVVAAAIEQNHDERGIAWPAAIAPYQLALTPIHAHKSQRLRAAVERLYQQCLDNGIEVLLDDRKERPGVMFADMELIGAPHRLVFSEKGLDNKTLEYRGRRDAHSADIPLDGAVQFIRDKLEANP